FQELEGTFFQDRGLFFLRHKSCELRAKDRDLPEKGDQWLDLGIVAMIIPTWATGEQSFSHCNLPSSIGRQLSVNQPASSGHPA
ncbi:hypothetical protein OSI64_25320, partial [Mycobacterium ulcerans]